MLLSLAKKKIPLKTERSMYILIKKFFCHVFHKGTTENKKIKDVNFEKLKLLIKHNDADASIMLTSKSSIDSASCQLPR